ncbi:MAG: prolipoprotein diacylglyceryl transferase [Actinomycetota bacterium]|nr:prolipoprotein diacylglyceryl transferase [Actinomycetota bacterium]
MLSDLYERLDPIAFTIGPVSVRWYGLAYLIGFIIAGILIWRLSRRWELRLTADDVLTVVLSVALGILFCARLGYVLFYGDGYYLAHPLEILDFHGGGMSFHGGLAGAFLGCSIASRLVKVPFLTLADLVAIVAPVGLFLGRCANFVNGELWGKVCDLPWGVVFADTGGGPLPRHPSQLYEALLEGLVLFIVLLALSRRLPARSRGTFLGVFLAGYALFRTAVEFVRVPDVQLGYLFGGVVTMGMVLCVPMFLLGVGLLVWARRRRLPQMGRDEGEVGSHGR